MSTLGFKGGVTFIEIDVVLDRPFPSERTIGLRLEDHKILPLGCEEDLSYLFKHISPRHLRRVAKELGVNQKKFTLGIIIIRRK